MKARRKCEYSKGHIFVLNDEGTHRTKYRKRSIDAERSNSPGPQDPVQVAKVDLHQCTIQAHTESGPAISGTASLLLFKAPRPEKLIQQALLATAVSEGHFHHPTTLSGILSRSIASDEAESLYIPPLACYTLWRGRRDLNRSMLDISRQLYIRGLVETQKVLISPTVAQYDAVLGACNALGLYEAIECPDGSMAAYHWHRAACCKLIQIRGPRAHQEGVGHELFVNIRVFAVRIPCTENDCRQASHYWQVLEALKNATPTYLSGRDWMTVPFDIRPKNMFDKLVDIFILGPEVMQRAKGLSCLPPERVFSAAADIVKDLSNINKRLEEFYAHLIEEHQGRQLYWGRNFLNGELDHHIHDFDLVFPPSLDFIDLETASIMSMYCTLLQKILETHSG